tara:strand:+ start:5311 stop:5658 length:348 start_codon:yes stop_codon:yes gene_type:complete
MKFNNNKSIQMNQDFEIGGGLEINSENKIIDTLSEITIINELTIENKILRKTIENLFQKIVCLEHKSNDLYNWRGSDTLDNIAKNNHDNYLKKIYGENYRIKFQNDNFELFQNCI